MKKTLAIQPLYEGWLLSNFVLPNGPMMPPLFLYMILWAHYGHGPNLLNPLTTTRHIGIARVRAK